jgi:hypothetical protein
MRRVALARVATAWLALSTGGVSACDAAPTTDAGQAADSNRPSPDTAEPLDAHAEDARIEGLDAFDLGRGPLPSGDMGIAARHPGDEGIASDPEVLFSDDFEAHTDVDQLWDHWTNFFGQTALVTDEVNGGRQALRFTLSASRAEQSAGVEHALAVEQDTVFLRWYQRLDTTYDVVGSSHQGGGISAHYEMDGRPTPGIPANGTNKYLASMECWRGEEADASPGALNVYLYHPEQRDDYGDHFFPNGEVLPNTSIPSNFGPSFLMRPNVTPALGRWYAFELMVHANTPGSRDGRIAMWVDGELVADFPNLRLRDVATLTMDRAFISFHARAVPVETHKWIDDVVVATSYIGPRRAR